MRESIRVNLYEVCAITSVLMEFLHPKTACRWARDKS